MRAFREIFRFEWRLQARSPLAIVTAAVFFAIHFFAARKMGVSIGMGPTADAENLNLNAAIAIVQNEFTLGAFMLFPAIALVATAITRDHERAMTELMFVRPIRERSYVLGHFAGGLTFALLVALFGILGTLAGHLVPGLDPERMGELVAAPYWFAFLTGAVPNTFITAALLFSAAAATRSIAGAFTATILLMVLTGVAAARFAAGDAPWAALLDPFGLIATVESTQYWTLNELTTELPGGSIWWNRALWVGIALAALAATSARYRFSLRRPTRSRRQVRRPEPAAPALSGTRATPRFGLRGAAAQFASQLRGDLRVVFLSPPLYIVLALVANSCYQYVYADRVVKWVAPLTSLLIGHFDLELLELVFLAVLYYAGELVHRERQARVTEIADASPVSVAVPVLAKAAALAIAFAALVGVAVLTFIALQAANGYTHFEIGLYLRAAFLVYGLQHYILAAVAVLLLLVVSNRWIGTLMIVVFFVGRVVLPALGFENLLYQFRLPSMLHSDMNGFARPANQIAWLSAYWVAFIVLALVVGVLVAPRGYYDRAVQRLHDARSRLSASTVAFGTGAALAFVALGSWVFYNTHVRNEYVPPLERDARAAAYERQYQSYADRVVPQPTALDLGIDVFPQERRVETRGTARLVNDADVAIDEVLVTLNPALTVNALALEGAALVDGDPKLGVYRYRFGAPLAPRATLAMTWSLTWRNGDFRNSPPDPSVVRNGTFFQSAAIMPTLGYDAGRELENVDARRREGLVPKVRLADLDDPSVPDAAWFGARPADVRVQMSTSPEQTVVAAGTLKREWVDGGRHYFEYQSDVPMPLGALSFTSARYEVARDSWNGIAVEIYHDPRHTQAVHRMIETAKRGLEYYTHEFGPYPLPSFRIFEYPRYRTFGRALAGGVAIPEHSFALRSNEEIDFVTAHELAHYWWGGRVRPAQRQGRRINETLASYCALMLIQDWQGSEAVNFQLKSMLDAYLDFRSQQSIEELPVIRTEEPDIAYSKGALAMYALQDLIGVDKVNLALRHLVDKFGNGLPPFSTTRDLVAELRAVAGDEHQKLITDLFEKIVFYDLVVTRAESRAVDGGFEVTIGVAARELEADGAGVEKEVPLSAYFDVAVFPATPGGEPLYLRKHKLTSGEQSITVRVPSAPGSVGVDPYGKMIDRTQSDNVRDL
jgi:ABC-type transport system involved in multi-copper enzyme maturation permease subunit